MAVELGAVSLVLRALGLRGKAADALAAWKMKPKKPDRDEVVKYCRLLEERRVFHVPMSIEVFEACIGSLRYVADRTGEYQAKLDDEVTAAVLGAVLDALRDFLDRWENHARRSDRMHLPRWAPEMDEDSAAFFQDLGELRGKVRLLLSLLRPLDKRLKGLRLLDSTGSE